MSTVRPGVMRTKPKDEQRAGTVEKVNIHFDKSKFKVRILETVKEQKNRIDITEAKILVSGGRGVGNTEGFEMLGKLAETLNAEVSSSRAMVDAGVMPVSYTHLISRPVSVGFPTTGNGVRIISQRSEREQSLIFMSLSLPVIFTKTWYRHRRLPGKGRMSLL